MSRLIVATATHPQLCDELVFRGGTCLHKLWLERPLRYSEDLDYVLATAGGAGFIFDALREVGHAIGLDEHSREQSHRAIKTFFFGVEDEGA